MKSVKVRFFDTATRDFFVNLPFVKEIVYTFTHKSGYIDVCMNIEEGSK